LCFCFCVYMYICEVTILPLSRVLRTVLRPSCLRSVTSLTTLRRNSTLTTLLSIVGEWTLYCTRSMGRVQRNMAADACFNCQYDGPQPSKYESCKGEVLKEFCWFRCMNCEILWWTPICFWNQQMFYFWDFICGITLYFSHIVQI
jgi:hypothetical protein